MNQLALAVVIAGGDDKPAVGHIVEEGSLAVSEGPEVAVRRKTVAM